ncbi:MAG: GDSL-type esterase/lipase family protein [Flavisolibacter sp.]
MKKYLSICFILFLVTSYGQQRVISLYEGKAPGSESWNWQEGRMDSNMFHTPVVYNVVQPTLTVYPARSSIPTGTAVIIAPGGGFHILSINSEGTDVANWLSSRGVTAFVLKYRLVHSLTNDPVTELMDKMTKGADFQSTVAPVIPLAMKDGLEAVKYVRQHAAEFNINPNRIGFMGFSAGGTVTMSVAYNATDDNRPDFIAPIYAYVDPQIGSTVPKQKMPAFIVAASDDQLGLAPHSVRIYNQWLDAKQQAELHMYVRGGHGFGMRTQNIPTDAWISRFEDWLGVEGYLWPEKPTGWMANVSYQQYKKYQITQEENFHKDWGNLKRFEKANESDKNLSMKNAVVFMGNSITEGWLQTDSSYFAGRPYINRGISGQTTSQMLLRFREDVINLKPAVVVILAGTNDIAENTGPISIENIFGNLVSMAELARANNIKVVLSSVLPVYDYPWKPGMQPVEKIARLNSLIRDYCEKNNYVYLDYYSSMVDERKGMKAELASDGVHPTLEGYKIMEPLAENAIRKAISEKVKIKMKN